MFGELEGEGKVVVADLEAGFGTILRMREGQADMAFIIAQPSAKSLEVARRALAVTAARNIPAVLLANRVAGDDDLALITDVLKPTVPVVVVPDDRAVAEADEQGVAPIDVAPDSPAVQVIVGLVKRFVTEPALSGPR
ncbi:MAG: hypothetical protein ACR2NB_09405 [Solirubrobacteraceae bacterium]